MKSFLIAVIDFYRRWLSPAVHSIVPSGCRYRPTCSEYSSEAIAMYGPSVGTWMAFRRLLRCHPFARGGFDPVPIPVSVPATASTAQGKAVSDPLP